MKFAYAMLFAAVAAQDEAADEAADPCECVGTENLPDEYFVEQGYPSGYGGECSVWDANEDYCAAGGDYAEEAYCAPDYSWCYVDVSCEGSTPTTFFADTEYADTLSWGDSTCGAGEEEAATKMYAAASAALAVAALAM